MQVLDCWRIVHRFVEGALEDNMRDAMWDRKRENEEGVHGW